ncbi:MAG TPA: GNAT family N-acetyltransferase [Vicinamibacterales bacterium]|nr:GNAT family N-acetyltransferase [Vicinamibacterales bacterium]
MHRALAELEAAITIAKASTADLPLVRECLAEAFEPYRSDYTTEMFEDTVPSVDALAQRAQQMTIWVARAADGTVIGTIANGIGSEGVGHLRGMAVSGNHHGAGVAARLLRAAEQELRERGCGAVTLDTTAPLVRAMNFYEKHGYRRTGRHYDKLGMVLIEHRKSL